MELFWNVVLGVAGTFITFLLLTIGWFLKKTINDFKSSISDLYKALTDVIGQLSEFNTQVSNLSKDTYYEIKAIKEKTESLTEEVDQIKTKIIRHE